MIILLKTPLLIDNQPYDQAGKDEAWARGVERCAYAREAAKRQADNASV
jgi:hypothetical protein